MFVSFCFIEFLDLMVQGDGLGFEGVLVFMKMMRLLEIASHLIRIHGFA